MPQINIRWADNTAELRQRLKEGIGDLNAMKSAVDKTAMALGGQGLFKAASNVTAAIIQIGGATKLTASEQERANTLLEKAIEKYKLMGQVVPPAMQKIADETRKAADATGFMEKHAVGATDFMKKYTVAADPAVKATSDFSSVAGLATKALGAFGIGLGVSSIVNFGKAIIADADALVKMSDKTGISTQGLQKFQIAGDDAGNTIEQLTAATNQMQNRLAGDDKSAVAALEKLGLNIEHLKRQAPDQQFMAIAEAIRGIKDPAEQVNTAMDIFGRQGAEILPTIKRGFDDIKDSTVGMSDETVRALDKAGDAWDKFWRRVRGLGGEVAAGVVNAVTGERVRREVEAEFNRTHSEQFDPLKMATLGAPQFTTPHTITTPGIPENLDQITRSLNSEREARNAELQRQEEAKKKAVEAAAKAIKEQAEAWQFLQESQEAVMKDTAAFLQRGAAGQPNFMREMQASAFLRQQTAGTVRLDSRSLGLAGGITSIMPGQFAQSMTRDLRPSFTAGFGDLFKTAVPQAIVSAFQGGGSPVKTVGSLLGAQLGTNLVSKVGSSITGLLGKTVGGAVNAILPGVGSLIGPGISALIGGIKKLFGGPSAEELKGRSESAAFQDAIAKALTAQQKAEAGGEAWKMTLIGVRDAYIATGRSAAEAEKIVRDLWNTKNPEAYKRAMQEIQGVLDEQKQDQADLQAALQRYGFTIEQMGPILQKQKLDEQAKELLNDWRLLVGAGIEVKVVNEKMGKAINDYLLTAKKTGTEVPAAMKPIIQTLIDQGQLVDENGKKLDSLEGTGLTFSETMTEGFDRIVKRLDALLLGLGLIPPALDAIPSDKTISFHSDYSDFTPPEPRRPGEPEFAFRGGLVTTTGIQAFTKGGVVKPQHMDTGGWAGMPSLYPSRGTDTVPAMLTAGEVVLNTAMQKNVADALQGGRGDITIAPTLHFHGLLVTDQIAVKRATDQYLMPAIQDAIKRDVGGVRTQVRRVGQGKA